MIAKQLYIKAIAFFIVSVFYTTLFAQDIVQNQNDSSFRNENFKEFRANNAIDIALGTSVINGDFVDPMFEIFMHIGYKRHLTPHLNINLGYNKFNLAYRDQLNEGFMSFDLNVECLLLPDQRFSPYVFAGGGYNASNYFKQTTTKFQGGGGVEYIVTDGFGLKLYTDYNYVLSDELDGLIAGNSNDTYFRIGFGINYYFGTNSSKTKLKKGEKSIIKSNPIIDKN